MPKLFFAIFCNHKRSGRSALNKKRQTDPYGKAIKK